MDIREEFSKVIGGFSGEVTPEGKENLLEFIRLIVEAKNVYAESEIYETRTVGMYEVKVKCTDIDWGFLESRIKEISPMEPKGEDQGLEDDEFEDEEVDEGEDEEE